MRTKMALDLSPKARRKRDARIRRRMARQRRAERRREMPAEEYSAGGKLLDYALVGVSIFAFLYVGGHVVVALLR